MANLLTASPVSGRSLADAANAQPMGTFPGSTTYPGSIGAYPGPAVYPGALYPAESLYPGKGSTLIINAVSPQTLVEVPA